MASSTKAYFPPGYQFKVKATDRQTGRATTLEVGANSKIQSQEDAERHVGSMPGSQGGDHPGFEVIPAEPAPADAAPAKASDPTRPTDAPVTVPAAAKPAK